MLPIKALAVESRRSKRTGYIGQGSSAAAEYYSNDFDYAEHMRECAPVLEAQLAAARALRQQQQSHQQQQGTHQPEGLPQDDGGDAARSSSGSRASTSGRGEPHAGAAADGAGGTGGSDASDAAGNLSARARRRLRSAELKRQRREEERRRQLEAAATDEAVAAAALLQGSSLAGADGRPQPGADAALPTPCADGGGVEGEADDNEWEVFFRAHPTAKFFRERRYLPLSFPCLAAPAPTGGGSAADESNGSGNGGDGGGMPGGLSHIVELGAGCGSSILPLLKAHPNSRATVCDVSATCLRQLRAAAATEGIAPGRVAAFVADATDPSLAARLAADPADAALIMFTLSAVPPGEAGMLPMLRNAAAALRRGGRLCIRDHGLGDLVQLRIPPHQVLFADDEDSGGCGGLSSSSSSDGGGGQISGGDSISSGGSDAAAAGGASRSPRTGAGPVPRGFEGSDVYYRRGDGTLAYFYKCDELAAMGAAAGLAPARVEYACVVNRNRKSGQHLRRVFVQAEFVKP